MTPENQRIEIAKACGWKEAMQRHTSFGHVCVSGISPKHPIGNTGIKKYLPVPDYLNDLNAMHEAEMELSLDNRAKYLNWLYQITEKGRMASYAWLTANSTSHHRAEAFLRTLGLWTE